jgi:pyridinium-3,5-bisthiocarboxylic acid mononucleotide nickel chelatase
MAKVAYFDCFSGCSGDMIIGSLFDAGLDLEIIKKGLAGMDFHGYQLSVEKVLRSSITATKFNVTLDEDEHHHHHRGLTEILNIIESGNLSQNVKMKSSSIFQKLGTVEAGIHGVPLEEVHFHELGAIDTIVDIVGTILALETLKIESVYSSPLAVGSGTVSTDHGILPVPAPATLQILAEAGIPVIDAPPSAKPPGELVTPTGAVLISFLAEGFKRPDMKVTKVGYGAGNKQFPNWPNVVRVWIGEKTVEAADGELVLLETNIDDMNPQINGYIMDILLQAGAVDVWFTPIQMKKNRPGVLLSVLGPADLESRLSAIILSETTTLGIRSRRVSRHIAHREIIEFDSTFGRVHVKIKRINEFMVVSPEYEDCRRIALEGHRPLQEVMKIVETEARKYLVSHPLT